MRVLLDCSPLIETNRTGIGGYLYNIARELVINYPDTRFVLFGWRSLKSNHYLSEFTRYSNVHVIYRLMPSKARLVTYLLWQFAGYPSLDKGIICEDIDAVLSFDWYTPPVKNAVLYSFVFDLTWKTHRKTHKNSNYLLQKIRFSRLKMADVIFSISRNTQKDLIGFYPDLVHKPFSVVYPGISNELRTHATLVSTMVENSGYILLVGTIEPRKNLDAIIKAYLKSYSYIGCDLVIVGGLGWKQGLQKYEHISSIKYLGYVSCERLSNLYSNALFCLYLPLYEGFGLPIIESLYFGKPILTYRHSSLEEAGGQFATYTDATNTERLSQDINSLYELSKRNDIFSSSLMRDYANTFSYKQGAINVMRFIQATLPTSPSS